MTGFAVDIINRRIGRRQHLIALVAGGGFYFFIQQKQKKQAEKEAVDPDADYTEDNGDFEIPPEDDSDDEDTSEEQDITPI